MKFLTLVVLLVSTLLAKPNEGSFSFMHFPNDTNSFKTTIEVKYTIDSLMGEPLVKARAKYSVMGLVNIDGDQYDLSEEKLNKLKIYKLKIRVPFESSTVHKLLYIEIDMGAMSQRGEWSYNTPSSPNWNKWIMNQVGDYLSAKEAKKAFKGFERLGMDDTLGSLAEAIVIKYDVSGVKSKKINHTSLNGNWYRQKDNRLLSIKNTSAIYPNGSKGKWKGHSPKYKNIKYIGNNKWECKEEFYQDKKGFFWDDCVILKMNDKKLKVNRNGMKPTFWIKDAK